jgi:hypothetical protein
MAGKHIKLRGYNVRVMTGSPDHAPQNPGGQALEWHRDASGEMGIGILLSDVPEGGNGGTALVRGSHLYPYDPRWNTLFSPNFHLSRTTAGIPFFARCNFFSHILARKVVDPYACEAGGRQGDFYFFLNDVWHGRYPNLHGRHSMIVLIGFFPTECPFPDEVRPPAEHLLARMPPRVRAAAALTEPPNAGGTNVVRWLAANRPRLRPFGWFFLARLERRIIELVCWVPNYWWPATIQTFWRAARLARRVVTGILGVFGYKPRPRPGPVAEQARKAA